MWIANENRLSYIYNGMEDVASKFLLMYSLLKDKMHQIHVALIFNTMSVEVAIPSQANLYTLCSLKLRNKDNIFPQKNMFIFFISVTQNT